MFAWSVELRSGVVRAAFHSVMMVPIPGPPPPSTPGMNYFLRLRRIDAMYRFAAALPFTKRAFERRAVLRRARGAAADLVFRLRRFALRMPPRRPEAFDAIICAARVCWPHAVELYKPPM
jgi:hypothetical protein